jgi:hypothetical protein
MVLYILRFLPVPYMGGRFSGVASSLETQRDTRSLHMAFREVLYLF